MKPCDKLSMTFASKAGKKISIAVENPRDDVDSDSVRKSMERLIKGGVFLCRNGDSCTRIGKASVIKRTVTKMF